MYDSVGEHSRERFYNAEEQPLGRLGMLKKNCLEDLVEENMFERLTVLKSNCLEDLVTLKRNCLED